MKVGIIGGLGALAGAKLYEKVIRKAQAKGAFLDSDFPEIVCLNIPFVGTNEFGVAGSDRAKEQLATTINLLQNQRCERIVVACNTLYGHHDTHQIMLPHSDDFLQYMLDCYQADIILQSRESQDNKLYQECLAGQRMKFAAMAWKIDQNQVDRWIKAVMDGGKVRDAIVDTYGTKQTILLGCTELCVEDYPPNYINSLDVMAEWLLEDYKPDSKEKKKWIK